MMDRVGQMMVCASLMRQLIGENYSLQAIIESQELQSHYKKILRLILDNDDSVAFSIQNITKMGLVHGKLPGEWYGPQAITVMLKVPISPKFTIVFRTLIGFTNQSKSIRFALSMRELSTWTRS